MRKWVKVKVIFDRLLNIFVNKLPIYITKTFLGFDQINLAEKRLKHFNSACNRELIFYNEIISTKP